MGQANAKENSNENKVGMLGCEETLNLEYYQVWKTQTQQEFDRIVKTLYLETSLRKIPPHIFIKIIKSITENNKNKKNKYCISCYENIRPTITFENNLCNLDGSIRWNTVATSELSSIPSCCYGKGCFQCLYIPPSVEYQIKTFYCCPYHVLEGIKKLKSTQRYGMWKIKSCLPKKTLPIPTLRILPPDRFNCYDQ